MICCFVLKILAALLLPIRGLQLLEVQQHLLLLEQVLLKNRLLLLRLLSMSDGRSVGMKEVLEEKIELVLLVIFGYSSVFDCFFWVPEP